MGKLIFNIVFILLVTIQSMSAQGFKSIESRTGFFSSAPMEDIEAVNKKGTALFNLETGALAFRIPIKGFVFRKKLMQQHFNENYMESDKFPDATFEGKILHLDRERTDPQEVFAEGTLTIHGVSKKVKEKGTLILTGEELSLTSVFQVELEDFDIKIPKVVFLNIAEVVEVSLDYKFKVIK